MKASPALNVNFRLNDQRFRGDAVRTLGFA
jgi:hypothetical protein